ncbi:ERF family protein [Micromonospora tarensis]|uniref:ERF family protein n=1 Tax=Micromonospora tarensis TaxID=2806100 RepID=A0ABS1YCK3_9ACTN|nr:ERF family protein [Micromonospora tarensis]MBM0275134.1 ERF family protein [Micromonospora tarensis]
MSLRERAASADEQEWPPAASTDGVYAGDRPVAHAPVDELPDIEYTGAIADVDQVPVHTAWARVMADVQSVGKGDRFQAQGQGNYQYRGVDRVLNAVGPALRRHGVMVIPTRTEANYRDVLTSNNKKMRECTVTVTYSIRGPRGDEMPAQSCGESMDSGDKGTTKACTVAYRNLLITALSIPTRDPRLDAEASNHERAESPAPKPTEYRDEITDPRTSLGRLRQIRAELTQHRMGAAQVVNEVGDEEGLLDLVNRIGRQRQEAGQ